LEGLAMEEVGVFYGLFVYFTDIWYILRQFDIFYGHLVFFVAIWYIFPCFDMLYQEKSDNPGVYLCVSYKKTYMCTYITAFERMANKLKNSSVSHSLPHKYIIGSTIHIRCLFLTTTLHSYTLARFDPLDHDTSTMND
jgi:hypothetical protein